MTTANNDVRTCGRYECSNAAYHADTSSVSNSMLSTFIESPELYHGLYVTGKFQRERTDEMDLGTIVHDAVLCGGGLSSLCLEIPPRVLDKRGYKTGKAWDDFEDEHSDKILLKSHEFAFVRQSYDSVFGNAAARMLLESEGPVESNWRWTCSLSGLSRRARLDKYCSRRCVIADIKTTANVQADRFVKSIVSYRYHVQQAFYIDAIEAETGECPQFVFIVVEKQQPFRCRCYDLDNVFVQKGEQIKNEALVALAECRRTNRWQAPGSDVVVTLGAPYWISGPDQWSLPTNEQTDDTAAA